MEIHLWKCVCVVCALLLNATGSVSQLDVCGRPPLNTKIVGGEDASPGSWPWQVSFQTKGSHFCGGSLINQNWILSAAHCFQRFTAADIPAISVYLLMENGTMHQKNISDFTINEGYDSDTVDNDIALVQLSSSVTFNDYVMPVCLAAKGSTFSGGTNVWVTGWGKTNFTNMFLPKNLQEVQMPIVNNTVCTRAYTGKPGSITNNMICAGLPEGGKDICMGDSGGPLVIKDNGYWVQAGLASFVSSKGCATPNIPGVYTRVSQYNGWINNKIGQNQPGYVAVANHGPLTLSCLFPSFSIVLFLLSLSMF